LTLNNLKKYWRRPGGLRRRPDRGFRRLAAGAAALVLAVVFGFFAVPASAFDPGTGPEIVLPIRCQPGRDCWLVNLVDLDPGPGVRDFACGAKTYDGHKGTDIAVRDMKAVAKGVEVVAAAAGVVKGVRDGMADVDVARAGRDSVKGRECGNGVVVDHGGGWETQYCHMRRGSIAVKQGDNVEAGARLGQVGHSGDAEFPHLHLSVRRSGQVVDPFVGTKRTDACGLGPNPLWQKAALAQLMRPMTAVFNAGFHDAKPDARAARDGLLAAAALPRNAGALVLWADMYWVEAGDVLAFRIVGPDGKPIFHNSARIEKTQARRFAFAGRQRRAETWPAGAYVGEVTLTRGEGGQAKTISSVTVGIELR
jgi:hypothetical protein